MTKRFPVWQRRSRHSCTGTAFDQKSLDFDIVPDSVWRRKRTTVADLGKKDVFANDNVKRRPSHRSRTRAIVSPKVHGTGRRRPQAAVADTRKRRVSVHSNRHPHPPQHPTEKEPGACNVASDISAPLPATASRQRPPSWLVGRTGKPRSLPTSPRGVTSDYIPGGSVGWLHGLRSRPALPDSTLLCTFDCAVG